MEVNPITTLSVAVQRLGRKFVFIFKEALDQSTNRGNTSSDELKFL